LNVFGDARKSHVLIDLTSRSPVDIVKLRFTNLNEIPVQHSNPMKSFANAERIFW
jgi:hypothetical protein